MSTSSAEDSLKPAVTAICRCH